MNNRKHLKNAAIGATVGAVFGATCGSGAGIAGLNQLCSGRMNTVSCENLLNYGEKGAASAGAEVGAVIGFVVGGVVYPAYKAFVGWCYPRVSDVSVENSPQINDARVALSV